MTEISGYKASRRPEFLFLSNDWRPQEVYSNFREYEQDFRDIVEDAEVDENFYVNGEKDGRVGFEEFQQLAYAGDITLALADMTLEGEDIEGEIRYKSYLPGEGAGWIEASFEVEDPELEEDIEDYVSRHFDSFLGLDIGYNPARSL
jgi:hypothetical protein